MKDARGDAKRALHLDPMAEIIAHVITAERQHRHGIAANFADGAGGGGRHFRAHGRADVHAGTPVESLEDERHGGGAAPPKMMALIGTPRRIFPGRIDGGALRSGRGEARIGMRGLRAGLLGDFGSPAIALPVEALGGRLVGHAFPPDAAFGSERDVREDGVFARAWPSRWDWFLRTFRARRRKIPPQD